MHSWRENGLGLRKTERIEPGSWQPAINCPIWMRLDRHSRTLPTFEALMSRDDGIGRPRDGGGMMAQ
jgi:hypothetical protein